VAEHCRPLVVQPRVGFEMFFDEAGVGVDVVPRKSTYSPRASRIARLRAVPGP
jgi:hypothetical protein